MSLEDISHENETEERAAWGIDIAMEFEKLRAELATAQKERDEARAAAQILTESGVRGHEAVCALTKERDGLAARVKDLHQRYYDQHVCDDDHPCFICDDKNDCFPPDIDAILAQHDASLTAPLERRVADLLDMIRRMTKHARTERDYTTTEFEDYEACKAGWRAALASTPREGTEEPKEGVKISKLPGSFDAQDWATEFVELVKQKPSIATDEGTMLTWFANAIMAGHDEILRRIKTEQPVEPPVDREQVRNLAIFMHEDYERISKEVGWKTQDSCQVGFDDLPEANRAVMLKVAEGVLKRLDHREHVPISDKGALELCKLLESRVQEQVRREALEEAAKFVESLKSKIDSGSWNAGMGGIAIELRCLADSGGTGK